MMSSQSGQTGEQIRRIILAGVVGDEMAAYFLDQITALEYMDVGVPVNVYINSPGGDLGAALGILDAMTTCSCPVRTIGIGSVSSAAVLLLAAGDKGSRIITPNCRVMIHQVSTRMGGNTTELDNEIQEVMKMQEIYNDILSKHTGQKPSKIMADMVQNKYLSAEEAIKYGIADKIMPTRKMGKIKITNLKPPKKAFRNEK